MGEIHWLPEQHREYIPDGSRSDMRATWHSQSGVVVISLWHGNTCVGTAHLSPNEAARLASFITNGLADLATDWMEQERLGELQHPHDWHQRLSRARGAMAEWHQRTAGLLLRFPCAGGLEAGIPVHPLPSLGQPVIGERRKAPGRLHDRYERINRMIYPRHLDAESLG